MDCSCVYFSDDAGPVFFSVSFYVAKKEHKCCECKRTINIGERYENTFGVWDVPATYKTCLDCKSIRNVFFCQGSNFTEMLMELREHLYGTDGAISSDCLPDLTPKARDMIFSMMDEIFTQKD